MARNADLAKAKDEVAQLSASLARHVAREGVTQKEITTLKRKLTRKENEVSKCKSEIERLRSKPKPAQEIEALKAERDKLFRQLESAANETRTAQRQARDWGNRCGKLETALTSAHSLLIRADERAGLCYQLAMGESTAIKTAMNGVAALINEVSGHDEEAG